MHCQICFTVISLGLILALGSILEGQRELLGCDSIAMDWNGMDWNGLALGLEWTSACWDSQNGIGMELLQWNWNAFGMELERYTTDWHWDGFGLELERIGIGIALEWNWNGMELALELAYGLPPGARLLIVLVVTPMQRIGIGMQWIGTELI